MEIKLINAEISFSKKDKVLEEINFSAENEKITFVIGESGSGKTMLSKVIIGDHKIKKGEIVYSGFNSQKDAIKNVGYIDFDEILPFSKETVFEQVKYIDSKIEKKDVEFLLDTIDLSSDIIEKQIKELSELEKRKLLIGLELIKRKEFIILDAPNELLDAKNYMEMIKIIKKLNKEYKITFLILSSDIELTNHLADMIYIIGRNHILFSGDKFRIYKEEEMLGKYGIPVPQIASFVNYARAEKNIKLTYREDIKDLIKDIYRNAK